MASLLKWPERERPRERLARLGTSALSDAELLALLIGSGSGRANAVDAARELLQHTGGVVGLSGKGLGEVGRLPGLGAAKGARILAALELGVRVVELRNRTERRDRFECSADIFEIYRARLGPLRREVFFVVGLNLKNEAIVEAAVAEGTSNECRVQPSDVFRVLISEAAARAVLLHNHPSGDPTPSPHDLALTRRLVEAGELIGIPVLDHVVIGRGGYSSMRDLGLLSPGRSRIP